jgi:mono/diheme cytochrome c family protein
MAIAIFVLFWLVLGLGLFIVAMSGGPSGARERIASQSRRTRRLTAVGFALALVVLGVGIPVAVIAEVEDRDSIPSANIPHLTDAQQEGRELFGQRCRNCHTLAAANASAQVGPNLDQLRPNEELVLDAIQKGRARGNGQMAANLVEDEDAEAVASFVAAAVGQAPKPAEGEQGSGDSQ